MRFVLLEASFYGLIVASVTLCPEVTYGRGGPSSPYDIYPHSLLKNEAQAQLYRIRVKGKSGFMNRSGEVVIKPVFVSTAPFFSEGLAWVMKKRQIPVTENGKTSGVTVGYKYGFINRTGQIVIPAKFDSGGRFAEGLAAVKIGPKLGYIDTKGNIAIQPQYHQASQFQDGVAVVSTDKEPWKTRKWQLIDRKGKVTATLFYDYVSQFRSGRARVKAGSTYGYIDKTGQVVVKLQPWGLFTSAPCEGRARVQVEGMYGYIDEKGAIAITPQYWRAGEFSDGLAPVRNREKWGFIDKTGRTVIDHQFDWVRVGFWEGMAQISDGSESWLIDKTGKKVIKLPTAAFSLFRGGIAEVEVDGKRGYIDKAGEWVWKPSK